MNRYLLGLCLSVSPAALYALGLGDIRLQSALNEPLKAEIDLVGATAEELRSLKAGLASRETFTRYGIDPSSQLNNLQFTVTRDRAGRDVLRVTSTQAMNDPFLTFLVEVSWARGKLLREYTVLLDPPVYMPGGQTADAPVAAPQTRTEAPRSGSVQRPETPAPAQTPPPAPAAPSSVSSTASSPSVSAPSSASSYTVRRNDTLWQIASQYTSGSPREVNRMMVALYRANPEAFNKNINELRAGAILRVPAGDELAGIGSSEAVTEVRRQYTEWREAQGISTPVTESESARLKLVTPTERGEGSGAPATPSTDAAATEKLRALEQQLAESQRLLQLKNEELARLQQRLGGAPAPTEAEVPSTAEPATPETTAPEASTAQTPEQPAPSETPPPAQEPAQQAPPEQAGPPAEDTGPSLLDRLIENWMFVVGGLLVLGALIFAFLRKREEPDYEELGRLADAAEEPADEEEDDTATTAKLRTLKKEENFLVEESGEHPQLDPARKPPTIPASEFLDEPSPVARKTADDTLSSETAINLDQGDPLAEADFHMAYGLYDQAADLVRIAIEREPHRRDLQLKLLEIYFVWGNKDAFLQTARDLQANASQAPAGEWDKIAIMGKQIAPDDPMFARAGGGGAASGGVDLDLAGGDTRMDLDVLGGADHDSIDLDFGDEPSPSATIESTAEMPDLKGTSGIDFVFDEPPKDTSATTREMAARTMETPTIETPAYGSDTPTVESPALREKGSSTIREKIDSAQFRRGGMVSPDQTAELSIDDLGLDVNALGGGEAESLDAMEDTSHPDDAMEATDHPSDAATLMAGMDERSRRVMEQADARRRQGNDDDDRTLAATRIQSEETVSPTGTWILDEEQIATMTSPDVSDATAKVPSPQGRPAKAGDLDSTAQLRKVDTSDMDLDLDSLEQALASDTAKQPVRGASAEERFSSDVFNDSFASTDIDLDVSEARRSHDKDQAPTERLSAADMDLPELEPVTMSEVGTKLDLARAYMDMGDPEGARNILDEVLNEGTPTQKQEAQRLLESLPG